MFRMGGGGGGGGRKGGWPLGDIHILAYGVAHTYMRNHILIAMYIHPYRHMPSCIYPDIHKHTWRGASPQKSKERTGEGKVKRM